MTPIGLRVLLAVSAVASSSFLLSSCSSAPTSLRDKVASWASGSSYSSNESTLESDLSHLEAAQRARDLGALRTDCAGFVSDVESDYDELPTPVTAITNDLNTAYEAFFHAAETCYGLKSLHSAADRRYVRELDAGISANDTAAKLLRSNGVS